MENGDYRDPIDSISETEAAKMALRLASELRDKETELAGMKLRVIQEAQQERMAKEA